MEYEVVPCKKHENCGAYLVEAIDYESEGEMYSTLFFRSNAEERARAYAALMNSAQSFKSREAAQK